MLILFKQSCNLAFLLDLEFLRPYLPILFYEKKKDKNSYHLAEIDTSFLVHTDIHADIAKFFITLINCSKDTHLTVIFNY